MQLLQIAAEFIICNTLKWVRKKIEFGLSHCDAVILWRKTTRFAPKFDIKSKKPFASKFVNLESRSVNSLRS